MTSTPRLALVATLLAGVVAAAPVSALVLCKGKKATVVARTACKKREVRLDAAAVGTKGDTGPAGPGLVIVDRNGREVGRVVLGSQRVDIIREIDGMQFFIPQVSDRGFASFADSDSFLIYANADCTGPPFLLVFSSVEPMARFLNVSIDGRTGYYGLENERRILGESYHVEAVPGADDTAAANQCTMGRGGKIVREGHDCAFQSSESSKRCVWCCDDASFRLVTPARTIDLQSLGLTPPFVMQGQ
jgi:hypothetical protein